MGHHGLECGNIGGASGRGGNRTGSVFADDGVCAFHGFEGKDFCGVFGTLFLKGLFLFDGRIVGCAVGCDWGNRSCRRCLAQHGAAVVRCEFAYAVYLALLLVVLGDEVFLGGYPSFVSANFLVVQ